MRLPRALMLAVMLTTGITAVMAYSQAGASQPALGAVVASDQALLALACAENGGPAGDSGTEPLCRMEDGRLVLDFTKYERPASPAPTYTLDDVTFGAERLTGPQAGWYVYVEIKDTGDREYSERVGRDSGVLHTVTVKPDTAQQVTVGGNPNCFSIDWEQASSGTQGTVTICLDPPDGGGTAYGFQPGADYELGDVFTVTNNSNARYTVTMAAEGSLDHEDLDVTLSSGGTTFHPSGDEVTLDPGETISVTVSFSVDEDWSEGSTTLVGRFVVTAEVVDAP